MKKAKRLLAFLLAVVMLSSAACISVYASTPANNYFEPNVGGIQNYYLNYNQAAGWIIDLLDELLADLNIKITCGDLDELAGGIGAITNLTTIEDKIASAGIEGNSSDGSKNTHIWLKDVDNTIRSLWAVCYFIEDSTILKLISGLLGDLASETEGLKLLNGVVDLNKGGADVDDVEKLEHLVLIISTLAPMLRSILGEQFDGGTLLEDTLNGLLQDLLSSRASLSNITEPLKDLLYRLLINSEADLIGDGFDDPDTDEVETITTIDQTVQQFIDWFLIEGTGEKQWDGGYSMVGMNAEALMPALADQPGGATLTGITIQADQDLDGAVENHTMSFYQLVNNVIQALLSGMLGDLVKDLLYDAFDIEITEEFPNGDPAVMEDVMFNTILGAVQGLCEQNGAVPLNYDEYPNTDTPKGKVDALVSWFLDKRDDGEKNGLSTFIEVNFQGFHIQDNFMSLLNDVARLAINLLPGLGLFADSADLAYTSDELNAYYAYDADFNIVDSSSEAKVDSLYLTYETGEIVYVAEYIENADGTKTPTVYNYYDDHSMVNTTNKSDADYINPSMIRLYYVVSTKQVYACLIKQLLDDMIDGCYFPEWADDIPSVLAYGVASLAAPLLPENNYFERLDAYYNQQTLNANGDAINPIPYTREREIPIKNMDGTVAYTKTVVVPQAALDIGSSYLAAYLNSMLDRDDPLDTDTSFEKFACELLLWGFTEYLPAFTGQINASTGLLINEATTGEEGVFQAETNALIQAVYSNPADGTWSSDDDNAACFDGIYDLIDQTIFKLLPSSWLPEINGSQQLILEWLLGNLCEFNLQGILGLLSINPDPSAELHQPVVTILIRIIDRVLALIFNDSSVIKPGEYNTNGTQGTIRRGVVENGNVTDITSLDDFLNCDGTGASVPTLVFNLLKALNKYKGPILATLLPLIASSEYERPYDQQYLGRNGIAYYKLADLKRYTDSFSNHINASFLKTFTDEADAIAATSGGAKAQRQDDGTYNIVLRNGTVYRNYPDSESANIDLEYLKDSYYTPVESSELDKDGNPIITGYSVYRRESYMSSAISITEETDTTVDYGQTYYTYGDFAYATFRPRNAASDFVQYGYEYQTFEYEDFGTEPYLRRNADNALKNAVNFQSTYKSFAENDLPDAYGEWFMYSVRTQLKANNWYDSNDDGVIVTDSAAADYDGGVPGYPSAMYPFSTSSTNVFSFYDNKTGNTISSESMNMFNATNYEQIAMAVAYGQQARNDVTLSLRDTEDIIRLAIQSVYFDITPNADGTFHAGHANWATLGASDWEKINTWMTNNDFTIEPELDAAGTETGDYIVKRPAFKLLDSNFVIDVTYNGNKISATPLLASDSTYTDIRNIRTMQDKSHEQKLIEQMHKSYREYITTLYQNRNSLYNTIDTLSWRLEQAEGARSKPMENSGDLVVLDWALAYARSAYMGTAGRNYRYTGELVNGVPVVSKIYTSTSYAKLQEAYDFAQSMRDRVVSNVAATNEITQSMITFAYQGILDAMRQLVVFTGFADWTQLDKYIAMAEEILNDPNKDDPVLGYASGLDVLEDMYNDALVIRANETIDCESQNLVDDQASLLNAAIQNLVFNIMPSLVPREGIAGTVQTIEVTNINNRLVGHVFGLEEGTGITPEFITSTGALEIAGMTINEDIGSAVQMNPSGRGNGTGAYFSGTVRTLERFRYIAVIYGDINGDSRIDGSDASYIQYYIANGQNNETDMGTVRFEAADADHNHIVDAADIIAIQDHYTFKKNEKGERLLIDQTDHR